MPFVIGSDPQSGSVSALRRAATVAMALSLLTIGGASAASAADTYPLSQVKRGQKGYGLTTTAGTKPTRFEFEVIGVNRNFLPKMDIILVKSDDPTFAIRGFWQGMSGSPLFLEGKLACAFSYGFRFNKVAIGGCTPIEYMKREGFRRPRRAHLQTRAATSKSAAMYRPQHAVGSSREWLNVAPQRDLASAMANLGEPRKPWVLQSPMPVVATTTAAADENGLIPAAVPLAMSGFASPAFAQAKKLFSDFPVQPMQAGGTGDPSDGPTKFILGGSISVQLVRGDMSIAGTGTVSYVEGNRILAFGHPMFQAGEIYAPVTSAVVHTVIPSAMSAFVVASPMRELGSLVQDRQSTISADTNLRTPMIPMSISVESVEGKVKTGGSFHVEVLHNRFLSGPLAGVAAMSALSHYLPDRDKATVRVESTVKVKGYGAIRFTDFLHTNDGPQSAIGAARGLRVLVPLLANPFAPVEITSIDLKVSISFDTNFGDIDAIRLPTSELTPGKRSHVYVTLRQFDGKSIVERVPFDVPAELEGSLVKLEITAGDSASLDVAPPESLDDLIAAVRKLLPGNVYAITLYTASEGAAISGKIIRDLPASVLDRLKTSSGTPRTSVYRPLARSLFPTNRVINGKATAIVKIASADD